MWFELTVESLVNPSLGVSTIGPSHLPPGVVMAKLPVEHLVPILTTVL